MYALFFFNDTATTEIYTLSLHDALPISKTMYASSVTPNTAGIESSANSRSELPIAISTMNSGVTTLRPSTRARSEEHTSELQSRQYLVCRLLLEKKNTNITSTT